MGYDVIDRPVLERRVSRPDAITESFEQLMEFVPFGAQIDRLPHYRGFRHDPYIPCFFCHSLNGPIDGSAARTR